MRQQLLVFTIALVWELISVLQVRAFATQSLVAIPISAILVGFWISGVNLCRNRRYWPALIAGACLGTWLGILL